MQCAWRSRRATLSARPSHRPARAERADLRARPSHRPGAIRRNLGASSFGIATQLLGQLAVVPLFLAGFGVNGYADWLLLSTVPAYLAASDLGFVSAGANAVSSAVVRGDTASGRDILRSTWALVSISTLCIGAIIIAVIQFPWATSLFALKESSHGEAATVVTLLTLYAFLCQQQATTQTIFRASGFNATGTMITNFTRLTEMVAPAIVALATHKLVVAAVCMLAARLVGLAVHQVLAIRLHSGLSIGIRGISSAHIKRLAGPSASFVGLPLGNLISIQGFLAVLSHLVSGPDLVMFSLLRTLSRIGTQLVGVIESSVWPEVTRLHAEGSKYRLRTLYQRATAASLYLALGSAVLFAAGAPLFIYAWTGGRIVAPELIAMLLGIDIIVTALWTTGSVLPAAINRLGRVSAAYVVLSGASVVSLPLLVSSCGLPSAAAAMVVADLLLVPIVIRQSSSILGVGVFDIIRGLRVGSLRSQHLE